MWHIAEKKNNSFEALFNVHKMVTNNVYLSLALLVYKIT